MADPNIPTVHDLASDPLVHRFDEMFNPPGLTNFLGAAQVDHDLAAVRSIAFPPLAQGETVTGNLFVDGRLFRSYGLPEPATALLEALADFEIATLLDRGLRLRTRCDLVVKEVRGERPDAAEAAQRVAKFTADCANELDPVTEVVWSGRGK